jgi:beta-fructofuranosidase
MAVVGMVFCGLSVVAHGGTMKVQANRVAEVAMVKARNEGRYPSQTPRFTFAETLEEQEEQLKTNPLMLRFAASRLKHSTDPYRPAYHFVSPESRLNDGNGLCFWKGRWHLFYQGYPPDEFPDIKDTYKRRQHWGHAVSDDLVHWDDLPYAIYPGIERMCFSGGTLVEEDRVSAYYLGVNAGQMLATSSDPLLLNWNQQLIRTSHAGDGDIWKQGDKYIGLVGGMRLSSSSDLINWQKLGRMVDHNAPFARECDDASCPNFHPIGDKHILLCFSHKKGGQYLLGDYDAENLKFTPYAHGRFNRGLVMPGSVHAPSSASDDKGRLYNIFNINTGKGSSDDWDHVMSVPQQLSLDGNKQLLIKPVDALESLRTEHKRIGRTVLEANKEIVFDTIKGNAMELDVEIAPQESGLVQLSLLRSPDAEERTTITFYNHDRKLGNWYATPSVIVLDGSESSNRPDVDMRPPERATLGKGRGEPLKLHIFIDRSIVEVFANGKQYMAMRVYPDRSDSVGVSIRAQGQNALLNKLDAWQMKAIWPITPTKN